MYVDPEANIRWIFFVVLAVLVLTTVCNFLLKPKIGSVLPRLLASFLISIIAVFLLTQMGLFI